MLDPNMFFSRFSFFESDKRSIDIKFRSRKGGVGLPALKAKYNTRSALVKALIPTPSDGKVRMMFKNFGGAESSLPVIDEGKRIR